MATFARVALFQSEIVLPGRGSYPDGGPTRTGQVRYGFNASTVDLWLSLDPSPLGPLRFLRYLLLDSEIRVD